MLVGAFKDRTQVSTFSELINITCYCEILLTPSPAAPRRSMNEERQSPLQSREEESAVTMNGIRANRDTTTPLQGSGDSAHKAAVICH